jgi:hypothetical protein
LAAQLYGSMPIGWQARIALCTKRHTLAAILSLIYRTSYMKKRQSIHILGLLAILAGCTSKQQTNFSTIRYASFDVNSYRTPLKDKPSIALYCEIDSNGAMKITRDDEYNGQYKGSTAQLSNDQLNYIQSILQEKNHLATYINEFSFKKDTQLFAGSYDFYYISYANGRKDSICTIVSFMSDSLERFHDILSDCYYSDSNKVSNNIIQPTSAFVNSMFNAFLKNKMLPPISTLPAFRVEDNPQIGK